MDEYVTVTPDPVAGRVLPEALVVATAGFLLGVAPAGSRTDQPTGFTGTPRRTIRLATRGFRQRRVSGVRFRPRVPS